MILACILCIVSVLLLYVIFIILLSTFTEFKPDKTTVLLNESFTGDSLQTGQSLTLLTWNIGYAGLGSEMDFFYEEGKRVRPKKEEHVKYMNGISRFLTNNDKLDFIMLQEVDFNSKRSYKTNQYNAIAEKLNQYFPVSAINYKSAFVPLPFFEPMGKVDAGQATYSKFRYSKAQRISTPGAYSWPTRLFMLKRCFLITSHLVENGKSLVFFNIHNSAFDDASELRSQELTLLKSMATDEYNKGNYVVIGGDWNQNPPGWEIPVSKYQMKALWPIEMDYMPGDWKWAHDESLPTNRNVNEPFNFNSTSCTLLDFFLTSPNINILEVKTIDLEFKNSDHLPVMLTFELQ